jgi:hypothetical protein
MTQPAGETLLRFHTPVLGHDGQLYEARACGSPLPGATWQGWIEFVPVDGGEPVRTPRETTQPNRPAIEYWATGLTEVFLEGALKRALDPPIVVRAPQPQASIFPGPAPSTVVRPDHVPASILDPFSVFEKGETLLHKQLSALSSWHLINIALDYELPDIDREALSRMPAAELVDLIVQAVRDRAGQRHPA